MASLSNWEGSTLAREETKNLMVTTADLQKSSAEMRETVGGTAISAALQKSIAYGGVVRQKILSSPLTLDINTVHRKLRLSEGNKKVTNEGTKTKYPDHPDRFDCTAQVLCREALTGTRCYWEVECSGDFMVIGVAYKGLGRKGVRRECIQGDNNKSWCLLCSHSQYFVRHNYQQTEISAPYSPRIGIYLDWPAGSLSFYSVSHTMTLLHRFNTFFTKPLYPGFCVGYHSSVIISHLTPCDH
ncbi:stonustoxin subunit beta-like [Polypterus senegalus]|uniref:stonustoxin subunit beta-like n=1 Tax=Polypterus senegalus TaxID=55291 RepID=UPI001964E343|nr:stonustoxin subunit beta-like [Polypterus senegalus]